MNLNKKMYQKNDVIDYVLAKKNIKLDYHAKNTVYMANPQSKYTPKQSKPVRYNPGPDGMYM